MYKIWYNHIHLMLPELYEHHHVQLFCFIMHLSFLLHQHASWAFPSIPFNYQVQDADANKTSNAKWLVVALWWPYVSTYKTQHWLVVFKPLWKNI